MCKSHFYFLLGQEKQGTYGQRALIHLCWGSTSSSKRHPSHWTCQHRGPSEDICRVHMGNTFPVKTETTMLCDEFNSLLSINSKNSFSPNNPLRCCRLLPYRYEGGKCRQFCIKVQCGNRLTLRLSTMAAGITPGGVYEVNDKVVPSPLNKDIDIWGHARHPGPLLIGDMCREQGLPVINTNSCRYKPFPWKTRRCPFASPPPPQQKSNLSKCTSKTN